MADWYELYKWLHDAKGTDKYHCPQYVEGGVAHHAAGLSDAEIRSTIGKYRNEKGQAPEVSFKDKKLQARFENLGANG